MLPNFDLRLLVDEDTFFTSQHGMARDMSYHLHFLVFFGVQYPRIYSFSLLFVS